MPVYSDEYYSFFKKYLVADSRFLVVRYVDGTRVVARNLIDLAVINVILINRNNVILINRKFEIT